VRTRYHARGAQREGRINLRVDPHQEAWLRAAAEANGESLTGFLLAAGAERAEAVLERTSRIALSATAFKGFIAALDANPSRCQPSGGTPWSQVRSRPGDRWALSASGWRPAVHPIAGLARGQNFRASPRAHRRTMPLGLQR
jgi:uncharacterized protein (DUF1778 family)